MSLLLAELRATAHTSVSQLKTFTACPRRYFLQYVEPIPPAFRSIALAFGTAFHDTVGEHLTRSATTDELHDVLRDTLEAAVHADGAPVLFDDEEQDLGAVTDIGIRMLDAFVAKVPVPEQVLGIEVPFSIDLAHPVTGEVLDTPLVGAMDAIVVENGKPTILELKTAKRRWSADQLELDLQPTAYQMGARQLGIDEPELKLVVTTKAKNPDVQIERLVRHRGDEHELAELAFTVDRAVRAGIDHRIRGWQCKTCPWAAACAV